MDIRDKQNSWKGAGEESAPHRPEDTQPTRAGPGLEGRLEKGRGMASDGS